MRVTYGLLNSWETAAFGLPVLKTKTRYPIYLRDEITKQATGTVFRY